ncbi:MAG: hypothetical protein ABIY70_00095 [Capsulimonas sp.]|uniref:hypothetical protein n=1 Tax=Capsulimonas sp. TaxID=2494211 RepID=UPI0032665208
MGDLEDDMTGKENIMPLQSEFTFRMESTSWKSQDLIYEESGRRLSIYLELSGVPQFDWLASMSDFQTWTTPAGEAILADERQLILDRLASWNGERQIRLDISQPMSIEEMHADCERRKQSQKQRQDGLTLKRILRMLTGQR